MRIVIDGNIGSGKSTQIQLLKDIGFNTKKEPIEEWPLKQFYEDQSRWAFLLQMKILETYSNSPDNCVYERCMQSSKHIFWWHLLRSKVVTPAEDRVYDDWYRKVAWTPDVHIYLRSNPLNCFRRIQTREQIGDNAVSLEYIMNIHDYYELHTYVTKQNIIDVEDKTPEEIHKEILSVLKLENAMHLSDHYRSQVS